ncbi:MAG: hypothetical protein ACKVVT_11460 [Dehalococcoidia bacterium]
MTVKYLSDQRRLGVVAEIAKLKFAFPNEAFPDFETVVNLPKPGMSVGPGPDGKDLYPDIVVVRRPGTWLKIMASVEMPDTVTDESALAKWLPLSRAGDLTVYVPAGMVGDAKRLCKKHGIKPKAFRSWRFRPVWGLEVAEA